MIPQTRTIDTKQTWQISLANAVKSPEALLKQLGLSGVLSALDDDSVKKFPLKVPQNYINKMRYGDKDDPLLRQVFPLIDEALSDDHFVTDPVGDSLALISPGVLQKYHGRALLVTTAACAIHCRYCFRRHYPYSDNNPLSSQWLETLATLRSDNSINEVILSGGDPLVLTDTRLSVMIADLEKIPQLKRLRIHTRLPIVLPERVDSLLLQWLADTRLHVIMVVHANHANELDCEVLTALDKLRQAGCQLLNQAVLLKGVNDNVDSLIKLSERLNEAQVLPYYLHLLDPVKGARHFDVSEQIGIDLIEQIRQALPGYLVPRLVREQQGKKSKTILA